MNRPSSSCWGWRRRCCADPWPGLRRLQPGHGDRHRRRTRPPQRPRRRALVRAREASHGAARAPHRTQRLRRGRTRRHAPRPPHTHLGGGLGGITWRSQGTAPDTVPSAGTHPPTRSPPTPHPPWWGAWEASPGAARAPHRTQRPGRGAAPSAGAHRPTRPRPPRTRRDAAPWPGAPGMAARPRLPRHPSPALGPQAPARAPRASAPGPNRRPPSEPLVRNPRASGPSPLLASGA